MNKRVFKNNFVWFGNKKLNLFDDGKCIVVKSKHILLLKLLWRKKYDLLLLETNRSKNFIIHSATIKKKGFLLLPIMSNLISVTTLASNQTKWEWNLTKEGGHVNGNGNCAKLFFIYIYIPHTNHLFMRIGMCAHFT